ncbi:MAG: NAD(+) synthase [Candidatus Kapabacteria bacterium]|nr:NAD(+) synthase [Candidatus Kapabacteria bacterium]
MQQTLLATLGYRRVATCTPVVRPADVGTNVGNILSQCDECVQLGVDIIVMPELSLTGYTCADLFLQQSLLDAAVDGLERVRAWTASNAPVVIVGLPLQVAGRLMNVAAVVHAGAICGLVPKTFLPTGQEYYDTRWFASGRDLETTTVWVRGTEVPIGTDLLFVDANDPRLILGVEVCEDLWSVIPPSSEMAIAGATIIVNPSASNDVVGKAAYRRDLVTQQSARTYTAYAYTSAGPWESTTDVVYGGHQLIAEAGELLLQSERLRYEPTLSYADIDLDRLIAERQFATSNRQERPPRAFRRIAFHLTPAVRTSLRRSVPQRPFVPIEHEDRDARCREILRLQALGLAVRMERSKAAKMVLGLSGGLDSTLALLVCIDACALLGRPASDVLTITMPGFGTTPRTRTNAELLSGALGTTFQTVDITQAVKQHFDDIGHDHSTHDVVFENAQARERTQILMDVANKVNGLVIGTGDLSELALGWCTYNADHMSMYAVNAGVPKTLVRYLIEWYADHHAAAGPILHDILDTPISPELLPHDGEGGIVQRTEDVVGPYELHDFFLYHIVRQHATVPKIIALAMIAHGERYSSAEICHWLGIFLRRFFSQQFKRSCLPDGVKVGSVVLSPRADWRMPSDASADVWLQDLARVKTELGIVA